MVYPLKTMLRLMYKIFYKLASFLLNLIWLSKIILSFCNKPVSLQVMRYPVSSFLFSYKKTCLCQEYVLQKKTIRNSCNPKELPIYFSMIKKMPLNILQQKLQIYTQTGSSRGQWSHWFVLFFFCPFPPKLHPNYIFQNKLFHQVVCFSQSCSGLRSSKVAS